MISIYWGIKSKASKGICKDDFGDCKGNIMG